VDFEREQDIEHLRRVGQALQSANGHLIEALARKCKELESLKGSEGELQQTLALIDKLTAQAESVSDEATKKPSKPKAKRRQRSKTGPTAQPNLPKVERTYQLDEPDRMCPSCGGDLQPMAGQFETSEMIDIVQVRYELVSVKQQKYVCRCGGCVETAPGPLRAIAGGRYSLAFAIKVAIDKYLDHLPLERQVRILARHGVQTTSQTLWDQLQQLSKDLSVVDEALLGQVMNQPVIGLDQTGWPRLGAGRKARPWQIWCLTAPGVVVHRIRDDKSARTFKDLVGDYRGVIVCDALATHGAGARDRPGIVLAGCWAHVLRKFREATDDHPDASRMLEWISRLYQIDTDADGDLDKLAALRAAQSAAVVAEMKQWLWHQASLKTLSIGNAAAYTIANWERLTRFVDDPRVPLDNNATERAIRGPVVGRKNHYGSKSRRGTEVAATLYSILETAKLHGIDPERYLYAAVYAARLGETLLPADFSS
jgi:transposase